MVAHKWAKEIKAWADGAEIEVFMKSSQSWVYCKDPDWLNEYEYRIKPQPKKPQYLYVYQDLSGNTITSLHENLRAGYIGKIKLECNE